MILPRFIQKVISTLSTINRRDVVTFSIFVAVSFVFWTVRSAYEQSDTTYEVKLSIENMPAGAVFTTHIPASLKVTLYDNNIHMVRYGKSSNFRRLTVDFNRYADAAGNFRISGAELQSLLMNELSSTTQITAISPALIDARYALTEGKKVPVRLLSEITTLGNHKNFEAELQPESVLVHAPSYILDTLSCINTHWIKANNISDSLFCRVGLNLGVGIKATPDSVDVTIPVMQYVNKTIPNIRIRVKDLPAGKKLILFPRQVDLQCLANFSHYNKFTSEDFILSVSYDSLLIKPERQFLPISIYTPLSTAEVYNIQLSTDEVEFSLEE